MDYLAIVIPAYKPDYLAAALESLATQSDKRFTVYIGDDASPYRLEEIIIPFKILLDLHYFRFENNLGSTDLVAQWTRCVGLSKESWVWLFSDDDLAENNCVEAFYSFLQSAKPNAKLLRFQTDIIDGDSKIIRSTCDYPTYLSAYDFALGRLQFKLSSFAVEYIFSRNSWIQYGGFVNFPAGWCADDASWIRLADFSGILTLPSGRVKWRQSGRNITAGNSPYVWQKIEAMLMYMSWLMAYFDRENLAKRKALQVAFHNWFFKLFIIINPLLGPIGMLRLGSALTKHLSSSLLMITIGLAKNEYSARRTSFKHFLIRLNGKRF